MLKIHEHIAQVYFPLSLSKLMTYHILTDNFIFMNRHSHANFGKKYLQLYSYLRANSYRSR